MPRRGNTKQRDYSWRTPDGRPGHRKIRAEWAPHVARGEVHCHGAPCWKPRGTTRILPGEPWDLGHNIDRTAWTGPEHRHCNRKNAAIAGNKARGQASQRMKPWHSQSW